MFMNPFAVAAAMTKTTVAMTNAYMELMDPFMPQSAQKGPDMIGKMCESARGALVAQRNMGLRTMTLSNGSQ